MAKLEFRDGEREVADYLVSMMRGIETHRLTYNEAIHEANRKAEADFFHRQRLAIMRQHFKENR